MLYEFSPGIYINLRQVSSVEVRSDRIIVIHMLNRKKYFQSYNTPDEMEIARKLLIME